ncbi:MAG: FAD-dependent oxidoreductase [Blastocatellia bacterium]|nr:FAD-dependent oxidoreductase [Blastocatellia bacterium]
MTSLAIIGTGIAGLGCAYFLQRDFDLTLFEQNDYVGGHTNTVTVEEQGREVPIDTGFMVYNEVTYPNLTRLFKQLEVPVKPTSMSFSAQHRPTGLEYCGTSLNHLFAQRKNLFNFRFWRMLAQINRFNGDALEALADPAYASISLAEYVAARGYGADFLNLYLIPMSGAVWSTPPEKMLQFPARTLLRFFHNHGFLGLYTQHPWLTVEGGAKSYVERMTKTFRDRIRLRQPVVEVRREREKVRLRTADGQEARFDKVIFASHANQTLAMLADATEAEQTLLQEFKYQKNDALLHTDASLMPKTRLSWASWNYRIEQDERGSLNPMTIYWMNSLQGVSEQQNYFVSINGADKVNPNTVLKRIQYEHPLFTLNAVEAQKELPRLNRQSPAQTTYFCGSYFKYGFHEDAFASAVDVSEVMLGRPIWN